LRIYQINRSVLKAKLYIICFIIISLIGCKSDDVVSSEIYFVQITDTHFDEPGSRERIEKVINSVNKLTIEIECVIHTGDITQEKLENDSIVSHAIALFNKFKMPVHFLPGNHDILRKKYTATKESYTKNFGGLSTYQEYKGIVFITLYTEPLARDFTDELYNPLQELESGLVKANGRPVLLFHHTPSVEDFYRNKMHPGWKEQYREKWINIINDYNVKAVIAGHFHRDEHHWLGDVPLYISAPISANWDRQLSYRIYDYKDGKIGYRTQYIQ